jgi:hypothetical protein
MARDGVGELVAGLEPVFRFTEPRDPATGTMEILHEGFLVRFDIEAMLAALARD